MPIPLLEAQFTLHGTASRMLVVRLNDRGPYQPDRIVALSQAVADRLNLTSRTQIRLDYIAVAPDGSLSGPGTVGTTVMKQSYALPARPDISGNSSTAMPAIMQPETSAAPQAQNIRPINNDTLYSDETSAAPIRSSGFLGAPQPLRDGVLESSESSAPAITPTSTVAPAVVTSAAASVQTSNNSARGKYVVQVGALNNRERAQNLADTLSQRFGVKSIIDAHNNVYRVQLGGFSSRQQAASLQQRLTNEATLDSFITIAPSAM